MRKDKLYEKNIFKRDCIWNYVFLITTIRLIWNFLYGFRWPSAYIITSSIFTYDFGFIPRGLVASVLKLIFGNHIYSYKFLYILITGISVFVLFCFIYFAYYFTKKTKNLIGAILVLWYSLSIFSAYLSHEAGYFEQYGYVFLCIVLISPVKIKGSMFFSAICSGLAFISLLIGETNAFMTWPVLLAMSFIKVIECVDIKDHNGFKRNIFGIIIFNMPNVIYCLCTGLIPVSKERIENQVNMIREINNFKYLDGVAAYYYEGRMSDFQHVNYVNEIHFQVWDWQMKCYILLPTLTIMAVLLFMHCYRKAFYYLCAVIFIMICTYSINFLAWDTERYKFGAAMAVTFFDLWIIKRVDIKKIIWNKDIAYILVIGTMVMIIIMDYRLELFDNMTYNSSWQQFKDTLQNTWMIN